MQVFLTINKDGMKINVDANANNLLANEYVMGNVFGILVAASANLINHVA